jgi:hypothetical protein
MRSSPSYCPSENQHHTAALACCRLSLLAYSQPVGLGEAASPRWPTRPPGPILDVLPPGAPCRARSSQPTGTPQGRPCRPLPHRAGTGSWWDGYRVVGPPGKRDLRPRSPEPHSVELWLLATQTAYQLNVTVVAVERVYLKCRAAAWAERLRSIATSWSCFDHCK